MQVRVRLFAMLRERAGWREHDFELGEGATVADAWAAVVAAVPEVAGYSAVVRFARNGRYVPIDEPLAAGDEVAVIPPVAGGAGDGPADDGSLLDVRLTDRPINDDLLGELRRSVPTAADGALVLFVGQTRETPGPPAPGEESVAARHADDRVAGLDYEAYPEMAVSVLREIGRELEQRFAVRRLVIVHRTGRVELSEPSVVIAVAAPHRDAAFDACRYAIEQLKARAPIWKREVYEQGGVWSGASPSDGAAPD